jgi:hypothetical protein
VEVKEERELGAHYRVPHNLLHGKFKFQSAIVFQKCSH